MAASVNAIKTLQNAIALLQNEKVSVTHVVGASNIPGYESYTGELLNGVPEGHGTGTITEGEFFSYTFKNGIPHGQGEYKDHNKKIYYKGMYSNGQKHGHGKYTDITKKIIYEGMFNNGDPCGQGKYTCGSLILEGLFSNGKLHGPGKTTDGNTIWVGMFSNGHLHGQGKKITRNGNEYVGTFSHGELHGQGKSKIGANCTVEGIFVHGNPNGKITITRGDKVTEEVYKYCICKHKSKKSQNSQVSILPVQPVPINEEKENSDMPPLEGAGGTGAVFSKSGAGSLAAATVSDTVMTIPSISSGEKRKNSDSSVNTSCIELTAGGDDISLRKRMKIECAEALFGFTAAASSSS